MTTTLVLASGSPRRRELLERFGMAFDVRPTDVDEAVRPGEDAEDLVRRLAVEKAQAAVDAAPEGELVVVSADTVVAIDHDVLGKPVDEADAVRMLRRLSGRTHRVLTGVAVASRSGVLDDAFPPADGGGVALGTAVDIEVEVAATEVTMVDLGDAEIAWYVATGEPLDKAGAYGIQGRGGIFVSSLFGSFDNVVGLPLTTTRRLLGQAGLDPLNPSRD
jgi:septum formation protein